MITDYVPSAYMVHDQLHIRGGHQVSWLLDGVPVPNTSIASNVGPQFDPKDIDYLEVQRGGYSAEYGDRTYGVFNVVTRSGFERNRQAELVTSYGKFNNTNDQISFGDHTERFAYYGSLSGYRTDLGLETPVPRIVNDQAAGLSGFGSIIFNKTPTDQLRLTTSVRGDHYQVPIDPASSNILHDVENERDDFVNFSWLHTAANGVLITVSPFYHFNRAHYSGRPEDAIRSEYDRGSNFIGGVTTLGVRRGRHNFHAGFQTHGERDEQREFGLTIPLHAWTFDIANFRTGARNFFDHDVLGDSDVFFPLTIAHARIRGWEASVNSPNIASRAKFHLAYSHQYAQGAGAVTGGLTDFSPPEQGYFFLDHDQRDTLSTGFNLQLPWRVSADFN